MQINQFLFINGTVSHVQVPFEQITYSFSVLDSRRPTNKIYLKPGSLYTEELWHFCNNKRSWETEFCSSEHWSLNLGKRDNDWYLNMSRCFILREAIHICNHPISTLVKVDILSVFNDIFSVKYKVPFNSSQHGQIPNSETANYFLGNESREYVSTH